MMTAAELRALVVVAINRLANEPHDTVPGLRRRYYYRGNFILLEHLSERALTVNVKRLRRRGEHEHADKAHQMERTRRRAKTRHSAPPMRARALLMTKTTSTSS
jgi:hypothetical protein